MIASKLGQMYGKKILSVFFFFLQRLKKKLVRSVRIIKHLFIDGYRTNFKVKLDFGL